MTTTTGFGTTRRVAARLGTIALALGLLAQNATAASFFRSVKEPVVVKECGACHMVYPPALLPARSWSKIINDLGNHFGDDATLPAATQARILDFYGRNAGDGVNGDSWIMRGVRDGVTPARITKMPFWLGIHGGFGASAFKRTQVRKPGNCLGCHG